MGGDGAKSDGELLRSDWIGGLIVVVVIHVQVVAITGKQVYKTVIDSALNFVNDLNIAEVSWMPVTELSSFIMIHADAFSSKRLYQSMSHR